MDNCSYLQVEQHVSRPYSIMSSDCRCVTIAQLWPDRAVQEPRAHSCGLPARSPGLWRESTESTTCDKMGLPVSAKGMRSGPSWLAPGCTPCGFLPRSSSSSRNSSSMGSCKKCRMHCTWDLLPTWSAMSPHRSLCSSRPSSSSKVSWSDQSCGWVCTTTRGELSQSWAGRQHACRNCCIPQIA